MRPSKPFWPFVAILHGATAQEPRKHHGIHNDTSIHASAGIKTPSPPISPPLNSSSTPPTPSTCAPLPDSALTLSIPSSPPPNAPQVPPDFVSFGFETAFLPNYATGTFSENLINSIQARLSAPIIIRIGGTTGDRITVDSTQPAKDVDDGADAVCVEGDCPVGSDATFTAREGMFEAFERFQGQRMTFQAPMGPKLNVKESLGYVKRAYAALGPERVAGIALGNEVDIYSSQYSTEYAISNYVDDSLRLGAAIAKTLDLPDGRIFEILDLASPMIDGAFSVQAAFEAGIDSAKNVKTAATHWYQFPTSSSSDYSPASMQTWLLNHTTTVQKFANGYAQDLAYLSAHAPEIGYVLSETGSSLIGPPLSFQDSFAGALWAVDFNLYAMSAGVARVSASHRPAAHHSLWVPDESTNSAKLGEEQNIGPQVRAPWFASPFVADFIGTQPGRVVRLLDEEMAVAYGMYDANGNLEKVAVLNLKYWSKSIGTLDGSKERGNVTFSIPIKSAKSVTVKRLRADAGAHALGIDAGGPEEMITWAGETWSYPLDNGNGHFVDGVARSEVVEVCDGRVLVDVEDTGAVMVFLDTSTDDNATY